MKQAVRYGGQHCLWCNATLTPHQRVTTKSCGAKDCERERTAELSRAQIKRRAQEHEDLKHRLADAQADRVDALAADHGFERDGIRIAVTPFNDGVLAPIPEERRDGLAAHLAKVAAEGFAIEDPHSLSWPAQRKVAILPELPVADAACATCQGGCCKPGGPSWGFIGKEEVCRFRIANPDATAEDFQQYYLDHLAAETITGSCIFHTVTGCVLGREDRSTLCNTFLCRGVKTMLAERSRDGEAQTVVIAAERGVAHNLGAFDPERGWLGSQRIGGDDTDTHLSGTAGIPESG